MNTRIGMKRLAAWVVACAWIAAAPRLQAEEKSAGEKYKARLQDGTKANLKIVLEALPAPPVIARGAFTGYVQGVLIMAGGATEVSASTFLYESKFLDTIYYLEPVPVAEPASNAARPPAVWKKAAAKLPVPMAFGMAVPTDEGLVCMGGWTKEGPQSFVFRLAYQKTPDGTAGEVLLQAGPELPVLPVVGLALGSAASMDGNIYVVGGCEAAAGGMSRMDERLKPNDKVYVLPLPVKATPGQKPAAPQEPPSWKTVSFVNPDGTETAPLGGGLCLPAVEVRKDELAGKNGLYVFGGWRARAAAGAYEYTPACWRYVPGTKSRDGWMRLRDHPEGLQLASAVTVGLAHVIFLADQNGAPKTGLNALAAGKAGTSFVTYHTYTDTWTHLRDEPELKAGVLVPYQGAFVWIGSLSGAGGTEEAAARIVKIEYVARHFGWLDFTVIALYMAGMVAIGEYFRRKDKNTTDYFLGGHKIPWWAAGLSIWATGVSAISYMSIPAKTYMTDWSYVSLGIIPPITTFIVAYLFLPMLARLKLTTIMEYFELRFGKSIRIAATLFMVVGQIGGRMSVVLLLPSIALAAVTGWSVNWCILAMGVVTTLYTVTGGMSAVVWTDVAQTLVMFGGAILSLLLVIWQVDGGFNGVISLGAEYQKWRMFDFAWDFSIASFWVFLVWGFVDMWGKLGQEGLQRAFSTKDARSACRSMITCALVSIPGTIIFYSIGTALFAFYCQHPGDLDPRLPNDGIFPLFIMQQLPAGVGGLVIAGIFAAAMSTLSGMNSVATVVVKDYYTFVKKGVPDEEQLVAARWITLACGVIATGLAIYMAALNITSLWDTFSKLMGLLGGGFGCVIVLGLLTRRTTTVGVWIGIVAGSLLMGAIVVFKWPISFFIYGTLATALGCLIGYLASLVLPGEHKNLDGLTLWTPKHGEPAPQA